MLQYIPFRHPNPLIFLVFMAWLSTCPGCLPLAGNTVNNLSINQLQLTKIHEIPLLDSIFYSDGLIQDGHSGFLQSKSKIKGGDYDDGLNKFSIGLIDFNGDQVFNEVGVDQYFITIYQNRNIHINNGYGTSVSKISDQNCIIVDSVKYMISGLGHQGEKISIEKIPDTIKCQCSIEETTCFPKIKFEDYAGKKRTIQEIMGECPYAYIYFWTSPPFEDANSLVRYMDESLNKKISVIGMHAKFIDFEIEGFKDNFFAMLANPWPQLICPRDIYKQLDQDLSWYKGLIVDKNLNIIKTFFTPAQVIDWVEKN